MRPGMPLPKYHQIYLVLREQLQEGRFAGGLPTEMALVDQFGVARVTVRKALERLVDEGLIERARGRGTRPRAPATAARAPARRAGLNGLLENIVAMSQHTSVKVLDCAPIAAPEDVARALQRPTGSPVQKALRVRSTREGPVSHITTYVPQALAAGFGRRELGRKPILVLLEEAGVRIGAARQTLWARLADASVARHLEVEVGSALLAVSRVVCDVDEQPVQYLQGLYRPDRYQYAMALSRVGGVDAQVWVGESLASPFH